MAFGGWARPVNGALSTYEIGLIPQYFGQPVIRAVEGRRHGYHPAREWSGRGTRGDSLPWQGETS